LVDPVGKDDDDHRSADAISSALAFPAALQ